ncbi:nuclear transport factor 2 family protein, partial [Chroococcidiopsis sp.]|uniref:nuclear transport factor 2 family protein n=1 Tax=Chroococcidiopsis sp. TaxID=3088168 RepID=UPI003F31B5A2
QDIIAQDNKAMTLNHERAFNRSTGRVYEVPIVHYIVVQNGKIAKFNGFMETGPLIAAFLDRDI